MTDEPNAEPHIPTAYEYDHANDNHTDIPAGDEGRGERGRPEWYAPTDTGNAYRLVHYHRDALAYVEGWGWLHYDGARWKRGNSQKHAIHAAIDVARRIKAEAASLRLRADQREKAASDGVVQFGPKPEVMRARAIALTDWAVDSENITRLRAMVELGKSMLERSMDDFDRDPLALNVANGTLRFVKEGKGDAARVRVQLDPHSPTDLISRVCAAQYDPAATSPLWEAHLLRSMPRDEERTYLQRLIGYCATGYTGEQCAFFWQGRGADGKSTTANVFRRILGDYGATADVATFLDSGARAGDKASPDLAKLSGDVRFVSVSEPPKGARLDEGRMKQVTGGAPLATRFLNKDLFEYSPRWKLCLECNVKPGITGADDGIWRRINLLEWSEQLAKEDRVKGFEDQLMAQRNGILTFIVGAVRAYLLGGLNPPASVTAAVDQYRIGSNSFKQWLNVRTERDASAIATASSLFHDYEAFCEGIGATPMKQTGFGRALGDEQIGLTTKEPGTSRARRQGLRLLPPGVFNDESGETPPTANQAQPPTIPEVPATFKAAGDPDAPSWAYDDDTDPQF